MDYKSDVELGERYRDTQTGFEGHAVVISFYEHACERVTLKAMVEGKITEFSFDSPEIEHIDTGKKPVVTKSGGSHDRASMRR